MTKKIYSIIALLFLFNLSFAQNQTKHWFFGNNCGMDFNGGAPVTLTLGAMATSEGCSTISDATGALLFYTDGITVWNKTHTVMPNGTGLFGDVSTTQSALIVKKPGSGTLYYIFTLPAEGSGNLCFSIVDMTLDGGNGDVTTKNTVLNGNVTEKLSAVHNCNGVDIWVLMHEYNNNTFRAFSVTATGVSTTAVSSSVGRVHKDVHGQMKFNNTGTRIACSRDTVIQASPFNGIANLDLFRFDNATGIVSSPTVIPLNNWQKSYGIEFSQDNSKVYASYYDINGLNGGNSEIIQYNMTATNVAVTGATVGSTIDPDGILRALQLGPDGKIYVSKSGTPFVCVINAPNAVAAAVNYTDNAINVDPQSLGSMCMLGLPGFVTSYFNPAFPAIATCTTVTTTAISENVLDGIPKIYFDPTTEKLTVSTMFTESGKYHLKIFNSIGVLCYENNFESGSGKNIHEFSSVSLSPGIYITKISGQGVTMQTRFLKQ